MKQAKSASLAVPTIGEKKDKKVAYLHANTQIIPLSELKLDPKTQQRVGLNFDTVEEYQEAISNGAIFPPIKVRFDGDNYWLWDGFHTVQAYSNLNKTEIEAEVTTGNLRDAILDSVGANSNHGLRRSREDKRKAVMTLLYDEEWMEWSNRKIAKQCQVSESLVRTIKKEIGIVSEKIIYQDRHGNQSQMENSNTKNDDEIITAFKRSDNPNKNKNNTKNNDSEKNNKVRTRVLGSPQHREISVQITGNYRNGEIGTITQRTNSNSAIIKFTDGTREVFQLWDFKILENDKLDNLVTQAATGFERQPINFSEGDIVLIDPTYRVDPRLVGYARRYAKIIKLYDYSADLKIWDKQIDSVSLTDLQPTGNTISCGVSIRIANYGLLMEKFNSLEEAIEYAANGRIQG